MKNCIPDSVVMCLYLKEHPGSIISTEHGSCYFKYDSDSDYFLYCKPDNKVHNGWYRARGLDGHFKRYMSSSNK